MIRILKSEIYIRRCSDVSYYLGVDEVMEITGRKRSFCYTLMKKMNKELESMGKYTVSGKIPRKYFLKRMGFETEAN
ncbi:hypothetical protein HMPREF3195_01397 [Peptostreptococcus anaerobius]|uniref:DNA-binding protein n=1 Tax=Peptostreptococcus anaerobius TaxID=1261 RepID=A0A135YPW3_9FIRM|nr:hypothetical protein HMPREF3195_01397 [Peptostreptococcus anaerobius]